MESGGKMRISREPEGPERRAGEARRESLELEEARRAGWGKAKAPCSWGWEVQGPAWAGDQRGLGRAGAAGAGAGSWGRPGAPDSVYLEGFQAVALGGAGVHHDRHRFHQLLA